MEESRREKIDLVWAAAFMSLVSAFAITLLLTFSRASNLVLATAIDLILGWTISILCVVLLLAVPGASKQLLLGGRILVGLACATLAVASILGVTSMLVG